MNELIEGANKLGITLTDEQISAFSTLLTELKEWNSKMNLTAIREDSEIIKKHFLDSLTVLQAIPHTTESLIDIGSGAGFPGLVIALMRPSIKKITLLESVTKKVNFLDHCIEKIGVKNTTAINSRAETLGHNVAHREKYDVATARAIAELRVLVEYAVPFLKTEGILIAQKSISDEEIALSSNALQKLNSKIIDQIPVNISGIEDRQLVIIEKVAATSKEFPRSDGTPSRKPL